MLSLYLFYACFWQKRYKLYIIISPNLFPSSRREFGSGGFMMCHAGAAMPVSRTVFRTRAIYVIMRTGHGIICRISYFILPLMFNNVVWVNKKKTLIL